MSSLAPIVLFVYNRPEHTRQTLEALSKNDLADESILYVYCDGPKENASKELLAKIEETRQVVASKQWCKEVNIVESNVNKGLADSIIGGVTEIVNRHGKIIVLEDDLVTSVGFLKYMNDALSLYQDVPEVMHISGYMFPLKYEMPETFFYNVTSCWGWGTWSRAWCYFNPNAYDLMMSLVENDLIQNFTLNSKAPFLNHLESVSSGKADLWACRWYGSFFLNHGLALHPRISLVRNIGTDGSGVNYTVSSTKNPLLSQIITDSIKVKEIELIEHEKIRVYMEEYYKPYINPFQKFVNWLGLVYAYKISPVLMNKYEGVRK